MSPRFRRRSAALSALTGVTSLVFAAAAFADNPIVAMPAQFDQAQTSGGALTADGAPFFAAVRSSSGAVARDWALQRYCTPYGPGTAIVGFQFLMGRWHASRGDALRIYEETDNGTHWTHSDSDLPQNVASGFGPWNGASATITPTQCIHVKVLARLAVSGALAYTVDLEKVAIQDTVGPAVGDLAAPGGWITGSAAHVEWNQSDNGFGRGTTWAEIAGVSAVDLGDPADGRVAADIPLGGLVDGDHMVRVHRSGSGWAEATADAAIRVDRTPPSVPTLHVDTDAWTNAASVGVSATASDATSGVRSLEFQVDGGAWMQRASTWSMTSAGAHTVRVRAIDNAGLVSPVGDARTVRIDRSAPVVATLEVDASGGGDPVARFSATDSGGSGLGTCRATLSLGTASGQSITVAGVAGRSLTGTAEVAIPMQTLATGTYTVRLDVCDEAGNHAVRTAAFSWQRRSAATPGSGAAATPTSASASTTSGAAAATAPTVTPAPGAARLTLVRPVVVAPTSGRIVLSGRLLRDGRPVSLGTRMVLRDARGVVVSRGRVRRNGAIMLRARFTSSGWWRLTTPDAPRLTLRFLVARPAGAAR